MFNIAVQLDNVEWPVDWIISDSDMVETIKFLEGADTVKSYNVTRTSGDFVDIVNQFAFDHKFIKKG